MKIKFDHEEAAKVIAALEVQYDITDDRMFDDFHVAPDSVRVFTCEEMHTFRNKVSSSVDNLFAIVSALKKIHRIGHKDIIEFTPTELSAVREAVSQQIGYLYDIMFEDLHVRNDKTFSEEQMNTIRESLAESVNNYTIAKIVYSKLFI